MSGWLKQVARLVDGRLRDSGTVAEEAKQAALALWLADGDTGKLLDQWTVWRLAGLL